MGDKYTDKVPTVGRKNLGKQQNLEVESGKELAPTGYGTTKLANTADKNDPKPGPGGG